MNDAASACPAGLDVSGFVREIAGGRVDRSMETIFDRLSLPGTLGRVCPRLCEESCKRCEHDNQGLAIAALHRYATDRLVTGLARSGSGSRGITARVAPLIPRRTRRSDRPGAAPTRTPAEAPRGQLCAQRQRP